MINNPKIGQKVWFLEPWGQCIHSAKITALGETEVSVRNPEKYPYADIEWDDGGNSGCLLKNLYASREELQKELKKEEEKKIAEIKAKIKDAGDLVAFMYDHCVACAEEYTDWTARKAATSLLSTTYNPLSNNCVFIFLIPFFLLIFLFSCLTCRISCHKKKRRHLPAQ